MNTQRQLAENGPRFLAGFKDIAVKEKIFYEVVLTSIALIKPKALKPSNKKQTTIREQLSVEEFTTTLLLLKNEVLQLKNDILLKDAEIEKLKLNLVDVKNNMEQFSYVASHDLKEPLRMVTSYLGLLKNKFGSQLDNKANTYIDFAIDGGAKLHTMFNGLLDLSQTGRIDKPKRLIPFNDIIEEVKINLSKKIRESQAQINIIGNLPVLKVYEGSVIKLMEHLICNAIKFLKPDETPIVTISAIEKETFWEFCVADNGIGIDACYYKQIFSVFSKLHNNNVYAGSGIGLAICKKAVENNGGSIWVTAELSKGSNFYFTLPK